MGIGDPPSAAAPISVNALSLPPNVPKTVRTGMGRMPERRDTIVVVGEVVDPCLASK